MGEEGFRAAGAVGADQDRGGVAVGVGDLGQCPIQDGDVVGCGVRARVARPQHAGQGLAGVVQEAQQRVVAESVFVGGRRLLLVGVAGHQGGVDVQDQAGQVPAAGTGRRYASSGLGGLQPGEVPGRGPGPAQSGECGRIKAGQQTPGSRGGGDRAEPGGPVTQ